MKGSKGKTIIYTCLKIEDYLLPQANISFQDQRDMFSTRCYTNSLGANRRITGYNKRERKNVATF